MYNRGLLFLLSITTGVSSEIWVKLESTCFHADKNRVTQQDSRKLCKQKGGVLHSVKDHQELVALKSVLESNYNYWVSATLTNGVFKWSDGRVCCPDNWWGKGEPNKGENCARLYGKHSNILLWGRECKVRYGYLCSKPAVVSASLNNNNYNDNDLCGVEIMPNCKGLSCEDVCKSHNDCDKFAEMLNVCVNIKNSTQTDHCVVRLRPNLKIYNLNINC